MRIVPVMMAVFLTLVAMSVAEEPQQKLATTKPFFERLDANGDGKVTLKEAPEQGKMLVEFLLRQADKNVSGALNRAEFMRLTHQHTDGRPDAKAVAAAVKVGDVNPAPENCAACAMGLTAEFVFKRLDVNEDKLVTVAEFMRSPDMQDMAKAREVVERLDKSSDKKLSWKELETAFQARHANCKNPDPATIAANAKRVRPDCRGDGNRFAQVFILRSDKNGDGKISQDEFRGPAFGFNRLDKNKNGFIEANELGDLHQRRLNNPKTMRERLKSGDVRKPPPNKRPQGFGTSPKKK